MLLDTNSRIMNHNSSTQSTQIKNYFYSTKATWDAHRKAIRSCDDHDNFDSQPYSPSTPHQQQTSPSLPQPGRCQQHQNPMFSATTAAVMTHQISYAKVLPRLPPNFQPMPLSTSLSMTITDTCNQSLQHPTLPFYKSDMTSALNSMTSTWNLLNSVLNTISQPMIMQMMHAPSLTSVSTTMMTNHKQLWLCTISK